VPPEIGLEALALPTSRQLMAVGHDYYQKAPMKMNISHEGVCICMLGVLLSCDPEAYVRPLAHASYLYRAGGVNSDSMALERHTKTIRRQWDWFSYSSIPGEKESALLLPIFIASSSDLRVRLGNIFFLAQSLSPDLDSTGKKNHRVRVEGKPRSYRTFLWSPRSLFFFYFLGSTSFGYLFVVGRASFTQKSLFFFFFFPKRILFIFKRNVRRFFKYEFYAFSKGR
jgi:hypothetical protein